MAQSELFEIIQATNKEKPKQADIERMKAYLAEHPEEAAKLGNLANQLKTQIIDNAFSNSVLTSYSVLTYMKQMRSDMNYDDADFIERGLIDNVCLCWLRLYITEFQYNEYTKNASLARAMFWEKALSAAQKRYLRAVETLARIRKLQQPAPNPLTLALVKQQFNAGTEPPTKKLGKWIR